MDRLMNGLDQSEDSGDCQDDPMMLLDAGDTHLIKSSRAHLAIPQQLLSLNELEAFYEEDCATLWSFMTPLGRPSFTPTMLDDFDRWQRLILESFGPDKVRLDFLVLGSRAPGVFCFGGDLELFQNLIRNRDYDGLVTYGFRCVEILHRNMQSLNLPILTVGLVEGAALGGGFEALLSFDYIIAERDATFGLPEMLFGLFPGMGAHSILSRKLGSAMADRLIVSNKTYSAADMYDLGIVHELAEPGEGIEACRAFIKKSGRRLTGMVNARRAMKSTNPIKLSELKHIVEIWAESALALSEQDLKIMGRLTSAQSRLSNVS